MIYVAYTLGSTAWSPPSFISPNNFGAGLMIGLDVYNAILVLRSDEAVKGFRTHNLTLGTELGIAAGPLGGAGVSGEMGLKSVNKAPIFSYVQSRGFYAGISLVGQAFIDRFDENERVYQ
jgi:lipid-binding SYLF domain-containing protein